MPIVSDPQLSPDGARGGVHRVTPHRWTTTRRQPESGWPTWPPETRGRPPQATGSDRAPRWSPGRQDPGVHLHPRRDSQIWRMPIRGGDAVRVTSTPGRDDRLLWSPDGRALFFWTDVAWGDSTEAARRSSARSPPRRRSGPICSTGTGTNGALESARTSSGSNWPADTATDVTPFDRDVPPLALGGRDIAVSPSGHRSRGGLQSRLRPGHQHQQRRLRDGARRPARQPITTSPGNDNSPSYSPDGRYVAYLSMTTPGFEADRQQLMLYERATGDASPLDTEVGSEHQRLSLGPRLAGR